MVLLAGGLREWGAVAGAAQGRHRSRSGRSGRARRARRRRPPGSPGSRWRTAGDEQRAGAGRWGSRRGPVPRRSRARMLATWSARVTCRLSWWSAPRRRSVLDGQAPISGWAPVSTTVAFGAEFRIHNAMMRCCGGRHRSGYGGGILAVAPQHEGSTTHGGPAARDQDLYATGGRKNVQGLSASVRTSDAVTRRSGYDA